MIAIISATVNGYSFGTVDQGSNRVSETNVSFQIDVLNLNNRTLELEPTVEGLEKGNATFPTDRTVKTSSISENPEGDGWIAIEPGRYAKPETFRFNVISSEDETGEDDFKLRIEAGIKPEGESSDINQRAVQVREYSYNIEFPEKEVRARVDRGFKNLENSEEDPKIIRDNETGQDDSKKLQNVKNITINNSEISQATKTSDTPTSTEPSDGIDSITVILSAGIVGSIAYLWMIL